MIEHIFSVKSVFEDKEANTISMKHGIKMSARELAEQMAIGIRRGYFSEDEIEKIALDEMHDVEKKFRKMTDSQVEKFYVNKLNEALRELFED